MTFFGRLYSLEEDTHGMEFHFSFLIKNQPTKSITTVILFECGGCWQIILADTTIQQERERLRGKTFVSVDLYLLWH